jgi:hypothetical protein
MTAYGFDNPLVPSAAQLDTFPVPRLTRRWRALAGGSVLAAKAATPLAEHGGDRSGEQHDNVILTGLGNSADYLTARIAHDHPDILERMKAGEFRSVRAAAIKAGIVRTMTSRPLSSTAGATRDWWS